VLIDAGISMREIARRLAGIGVAPDSIDAVVISHGHSDHVNGVPVACRRLGIPVFATRGTVLEARMKGPVPPELLRCIRSGDSFDIGSLNITCFPVPHDSSEPVGFVISDGSVRMGYATDLGSLTLEVVHAFVGCDAVVLESNHDEEMLLDGPYPAFLKKRVNGPLGHLSNADAMELLRGIAHPGLQYLALAHLSRTNNLPELPLEAAAETLGESASAVEISLGWQDRAGALLILE
jgi:phosphoribosyl 1,2-cyclic phosphodiesterase